eukprot:4847032-Ditylum_brightwellii.AAC.1
MGFMVDDNNAPAPENIPTPEATKAATLTPAVNDGQNWGWQALDHQKMQGCQDTDASVKGMNATDFA